MSSIDCKPNRNMQNKIKEHDYRHLKEETESEEVYIGIPVPTAPFLAAPVAPFESSTQRVAETAATYYGECFVEVSFYSS